MRVRDEQRTQRAARWLVRQHLARLASRPIPAALAPRDLAQAYAVQDAFVALKAAQCGPVVGHKIALTSPQMRSMVGLDTPIAGRLHARQLVGGAASVRAADYGRLLVEFEIGFRLGASLAPRALPYRREEVAAAVAAAMPALELADDRGADYATLAARAYELAADNVWNEGAVLGVPVTTWRSLDLAALHGVARINGAVVGEGRGADAMGHPLDALCWIANHLSARGQALRRGDIVICGSLVTSKFPAAGDVLRFDAGALGAVELQVT
ncbi:MAG TPA: fumarylacetoacetate hydrolase family protein [Burkholderiales bacterium]|nr:fumarylacetoacetate hydrolase family protein [Burkholderiales bacterium]